MSGAYIDSVGCECCDSCTGGPFTFTRTIRGCNNLVYPGVVVELTGAIEGTYTTNGSGVFTAPITKAGTVNYTATAPSGRYAVLTGSFLLTCANSTATWTMVPGPDYVCFCDGLIPASRTLHATDGLNGVSFDMVATGTTPVWGASVVIGGKAPSSDGSEDDDGCIEGGSGSTLFGYGVGCASSFGTPVITHSFSFPFCSRSLGGTPPELEYYFLDDSAIRVGNGAGGGNTATWTAPPAFSATIPVYVDGESAEPYGGPDPITNRIGPFNFTVSE